jgi:hypothetical protein
MTFGMLAVTALSLSACGGGGATFANKPRPPAPINLTVYINNARVSVSPASVGAGPVVFVVTNAATQTASLTIHSPGGAQTLATTGPINPQTTAQVTVDFRTPGDYSVAASKSGGTDATQAGAGAIHPATVHIGKPRPSASDQLLQP